MLRTVALKCISDGDVLMKLCDADGQERFFSLRAQAPVVPIIHAIWTRLGAQSNAPSHVEIGHWMLHDAAIR